MQMASFVSMGHAMTQYHNIHVFLAVQHGSGTANTALVYHANKLMSLHEGDLPYAVSTPMHFC